MFLKDVSNEISGFGLSRGVVVEVCDGQFAVSPPVPGAFDAKVYLARKLRAYCRSWERPWSGF